MRSEGILTSQASLDTGLLANDEPKYRNQGKLRLIIMTICLSTAYYGWAVVNLSAVPQDYLQTSYGSQINESTIYGILQGCVPGGAIIGAGIASTAMRLLTRKKYVLITNLLALVVYGIIQIPNIWVLLGCRVLQGVFSGLYMAIVPIYIYELAPKQLGGSFGVYTNIFIAGSIILCFGLQVIFQQAIDLDPEPFWRIIWLVPAIPVIIQSALLLIGFVPESPTSLLITGQKEEARKVISLFHKAQYIEETFDDREEEVDAQAKGANKGDDGIKTSKYAYLVAFGFPVLMQFVGLGSVSAQVGNIIGTYSSFLGIYLPLIVNTVQLIGSYFTVFLLKSMGRRTLGLFGNASIGLVDLAISVLFLFIDDGQVIIIAVTAVLIIFMLLFGMTVGPITWLYVPQIVPTAVVPYVTMGNWIAATFVYTITPIVVDAAGPSTLFFIFSGVTALLFVVNFLFMVETKGLSREEIARRFFFKGKY